MSELDEIRKRKIAEFQRQGSQSQSEEQKLRDQVAQLESMVRPLLTKEALVRYGTIKTAFPEKAIQVLVMIAQLAQAGRIKSVDDMMLKKFLGQLTPQKRETKIQGITYGKK